MNKSKHFVFVGVAVAIMLLVVGSWVTSAQACQWEGRDSNNIPFGDTIPSMGALGDNQKPGP